MHHSYGLLAYLPVLPMPYTDPWVTVLLLLEVINTYTKMLSPRKLKIQTSRAYSGTIHWGRVHKLLATSILSVMRITIIIGAIDNTISDWSTVGVTTAPLNGSSTTIVCTTTHITSFAVLVDVTGSVSQTWNTDYYVQLQSNYTTMPCYITIDAVLHWHDVVSICNNYDHVCEHLLLWV